MTGDTGRRERRLDAVASVVFGAIYVSALHLVVTGFAADPDGCGGRFQGACTAGTYARLGAGFGLVAVVAPLLHRLLPDVPYDRGLGRAASIAALLLGGAAGLALTEAVTRLL